MLNFTKVVEIISVLASEKSLKLSEMAPLEILVVAQVCSMVLKTAEITIASA